MIDPECNCDPTDIHGYVQHRSWCGTEPDQDQLDALDNRSIMEEEHEPKALRPGGG